MFSPSLRAWLAISTLMVSCPASSAQQLIYLGVDLGPEYITASAFAIDRTPIPVTRIRGSEGYRAYLADTLASEGKRIRRAGKQYILQGGVLIPAPPDTHNLQEAKGIFAAALTDIKDIAAARLGHTLKIVTISQPRHFNDSTWYAVAQAAAELEPNFQPMQIIRFSTAARLAYNLTSCAAFALSAAECDIDEDPNYIINVEYHTGYLEIVMAHVDSRSLDVAAHARYADLGELGANVRRSNSWLDWTMGTQHISSSDAAFSHYTHIEKKLASFLEEQQRASEGSDPLDWLRAITLSGDASPSSFRSLKVAVSAALGSHRSKIRDDIEPLYVGAVGAGNRGRHQLLTPGFLDDGIYAKDVKEYPEHDEL